MLLSNLILSTVLAALTTTASPIIDADIQLLPRDGLKDCADSSKPYSGGYSDGQGSYVSSDRVTHSNVFPLIRKCWYDYFAVSSTTYLKPWQRSSGNVYCSKGATCTVTSLQGTQECQTRSTAVSVSVGADIEKFFSIGASYTVTLDNQHCYTASDTTACNWADGQCHVVWTQQQMVKQVGYARQRCNYGHGDQTQCMTNWEMDTPTTHTNYGCNSKCTDTNECGNTNGQSC